MNDRSWRHPKVEAMAAFIEGTLAPDETKEIAEHLRDCRDCRTVIGETARFEAEEAERAEAEEAPRVRRFARPRLWAAAAAAAGVIAVSGTLIQRTMAFAPVSVLIDAAPREYRRVEGRLSEFPYARPPASSRGATPQTRTEELKLQGAVGKVLERTADDDDPADRHGAGVAHLLIGETEQSIADLERAAGKSNDARYWNDLAAARLARGKEHLSELPLALADADRALRIDPDFPEAQFNKALILDTLELDDAARREWNRYLQLDSGSEWAREARERLQKLDRQSSGEFQKESERARRDHSRIDAFVRQFPGDARRYAEGPWLVQWAEAEANGDAESAASQLNFVREIGNALAVAHDDALLLDAVRVIDRADAPTRAALVKALLRYGDARIAYAARDLGVAEAGFRQSEDMFRAARSPLAHAAAYYAGQATADGNRGKEAVALLTRLRARIDTRYRSLAAGIEGRLGVAALEAADFAAAARHAAASADTYTLFGEWQNAAESAGGAAHALERVGASDQAWSHWIRTFRDLRGHDSTIAHRRRVFLHSAALALTSIERVEAAQSILDLVFDDGKETNAIFLVLALTERARLAQRSGDLAAARRWLSEARNVLEGISDASAREISGARIDVIDGAVGGNVGMLDRAVEFLKTHEQGLILPNAYLQRARARRAAGDDTAALADYQAALDEIARQKEHVGKVELGFLNTASEILDDTVALHLARNRGADAFLVTDRVHAMLESSSIPAVPAGVALVEYAVLPQSTVIFCVTRDGMRVATAGIERRQLGERVTSLVEKIRRDDPEAQIRADAAALHRLLIEPVLPRLDGIDEIVIVTDRQLHALPFAVLYDQNRRHYLVEDYTIRLAPSAQARGVTATALTPAVVIADPATTIMESLPYSRDEAAKVAAIHKATLIEDKDATRQRFIYAVQNSALVHYAGHADSDAVQSHAALLLAKSGDDDGLLPASEIARLRLDKHAPLVVLSACGTLRGTPTHVAGMPSLARAFLTAGARAVVGTLWEVDDDLVAPLFLNFHEHLRADMAPARALRAAQMAMLQSSDPRLRRPSTWSGVEVLSNL